MSTSQTATALAGAGAVLAGSVVATGRGFDKLSSSAPAPAPGLESLLSSGFQLAPIAALLLAGLLIVKASGQL